MILELLFPRAKHIRRFDTLQTDMLARTAVRTIAPTDPSCLAPFPYGHTLIRDAVHAAKYHGHKRAAALLGEALAPFLSEELAERRSFGSYDSVLYIPIPLAPARQHARGYNQAERIVAAILSYTHDPAADYVPSALVRVRDTKSQVRVHDRTARRNNVHNAFCIPNRKAIEGRDIVLVDDVVTTGATMGAARAVLIAAGARNVLCVAVAH